MTMTKSTARVVLVALIAIALIAAVYMTAQGAFAKADSTGAQAHVVSGLKTNFNHDRSTAAELEALQAQQKSYETGAGGYHGAGGCRDEMGSVPLD